MTIYLNGQYMPIEEAKVSVLDRGFIFGDGVYEVIPVYSRNPFRLEEHLRRLQHSLDGIRLANPHSNAEWAAIIRQLIAYNAGEDQSLYLHIKRGVARRDHAFPLPPVPPTVFLMSNPLPTPPAELLESGIACITAPDNRWLRCDIKSIALLLNVLLRQMAVDSGCAETILIRNNEFMTEGAASNIFAVKNGTLLAPPKDNLMLPGITYDVVLELLAAHGFEHRIRPVTEAELRGADEVWITSSSKDLLPVTRMDGKPVGSGRPGPLFKRMRALFDEFKARLRAAA